MKELAIFRDVEFLFEMCNHATFMSYHFEAYEEETCQFSASLNVHFFEDELKIESDGGLGYITFTVREKEYLLTIKQLDELF